MKSDQTTFVLVHSPLVGPLTWSLVAEELERRGIDCLVPAIVDGDAHEPYWQQHAESVARAVMAAGQDGRCVLSGHSGAGALLPAIRQALGRPVRAYLFVDAGIPKNGESRLGGPGSSPWADDLRELLSRGGVFPTWKEPDLAEVLPVPTLRRQMVAELRPRGRQFWEEPIPVFPDWPDAPCGYLQFTPTYDEFAERARREGWPYRHMPAGHFHMLVEPGAVAHALLELAVECGV